MPPVPEDHHQPGRPVSMVNRPPMPVPGQQQPQPHNYMNQQGPQLPQRSPSAMAAPGAAGPALPPLQRPHSSSQGPIHPTNAYRIYSTDEADRLQQHPPPPPLGPRPGQVPGPESIIPASYDPEAVRAANLSRAEALSAQQREELFLRRGAAGAAPVAPNQNSPTASSVSSSDMPPMRGATTASFPPQVPQPPTSSAGYPNGARGYPTPTPQQQQPSPNRFGHPLQQPAYPNQPHPMQQQQPRPPVVKQVNN